MTDRINAVTVVLETDIRDDDAENLMAAMRQLRGVLTVTPNVADLTAHLAEERARHEIGMKVIDAVFPKKDV